MTHHFHAKSGVDIRVHSLLVFGQLYGFGQTHDIMTRLYCYSITRSSLTALNTLCALCVRPSSAQPLATTHFLLSP